MTLSQAIGARLRVSILGAGNWGTTLAQLITDNGHSVLLWSRDRDQCDEINERHTNERFLPGHRLSSTIRASADLAEAVAACDLLIIAIPSQGFRDVCRALADVVQPELLVVHVTKGLEVGTHLRMSQILMAETCIRQFGVLSGPNIAGEIAQGKPAGTVIATRFPRVAAMCRRAVASRRLRVFESRDVCGVELCGALKNVVAIAAGMAEEMQMGDNAKAFLVAHGMQEMVRLAAAMGAEPTTPVGLAGIGDLMVTCASPLSRNHRLGVALARGAKLEDAVAQLGMVAEGVYASRAARDLAREYGVELPLLEHIGRVLHEGLPPREALSSLLQLRTGRDVPRVLRVGRA